MHIYFWSRKGEPFCIYRNAPRLTRHYLPRCSKWVVHFQRPLKAFVARVPPKKSHKCQGERIWRGGRPSRFCTTPRRFFQPKPRGPTQLGCPSFKMKLWPPRKKWCRQESSIFFSHQAFQKRACYPLEFRLFSSNIKWWKNPIASCPTQHNQPLFWFGSVVRCVATSRSLGRLGQALHTTGRINLMGRIPLVTNRLKATEIICWNEITNNFVGWVPRKKHLISIFMSLENIKDMSCPALLLFQSRVAVLQGEATSVLDPGSHVMTRCLLSIIRVLAVWTHCSSKPEPYSTGLISMFLS